jgi:hypothetical protein
MPPVEMVTIMMRQRCNRLEQMEPVTVVVQDLLVVLA